MLSRPGVVGEEGNSFFGNDNIRKKDRNWEGQEFSRKSEI